MGRLGERALELFDELCDLSREVQVRRLDEIGTKDPELRAEVEGLLAADRAFDVRLEAKAVVPSSLLPVSHDSDRADESRRIVERLVSRTRPFEHYRIDREVGRGGMGQILEVWEEDLERRL